MSKDKYPISVADQDFDDIQAAVMETDRGRWFLNEFAQRNRVADTQILLEAIKKLEGMVAEKETTPNLSPDEEKIRFDIVDMANAIALTKQEIAGIKPGNGEDSRLDCATAELDAIVVAAETATSEILSAAEHIQEVAWTMREDGAKEEDFDKLDGYATDIYMACSFQDITGQRTSKVINVLQFLENRVLTMMKIWGIEGGELNPLPEENSLSEDSHLLNGPALEGEGVDQDDIDLMLADEEDLFDAIAMPASEMPLENELPISPETDDDEAVDAITFDELEEPVAAEPDDDDRDDAQLPVVNTDIDSLSQIDKMALFT